MKNKLWLICIWFMFFSCQKENNDYIDASPQTAKISFYSLLCNSQENPGCIAPLEPAMGATIKLYMSEEEREARINEVATSYTDFEGRVTTTVDPGYYYIFTLHMGREKYSVENAPVNTHSYHEVIIIE